MKVSDKIFIIEHGKRPRGRGSWCFSYGVTKRQAIFYRITDAPIISDDDPNAMVWVSPDENDVCLTYSEAKKKAIKYAKKIGYTQTIYGLS